MAKESTPVASIDDEHDVQEVRCSVSGMPIPAIPLWYADVKVNFVSDAARSKTGMTTGRTADLVEEEEEEEEEAEDGDISLEDVDQDIAADEVEMDLGDAPEEAPAED
jgi:hypothetical protein